MGSVAELLETEYYVIGVIYGIIFGGIKEKELPEENEEWVCPKCVDAGVISNNAGLDSQQLDNTSLTELIDVLKEDITSLRDENAMLRKHCETSD